MGQQPNRDGPRRSGIRLDRSFPSNRTSYHWIRRIGPRPGFTLINLRCITIVLYVWPVRRRIPCLWSPVLNLKDPTKLNGQNA